MRRRDARGRSGARSILLPHRWRLVILAIVWLKAEIGERGGGEGATPRRGRWKGGEGGRVVRAAGAADDQLLRGRLL